MTCFLFRLLSCDQENGQYKRGKFIRQSRFPLSSHPWLLWLLHDNLTKRYAEEKPKRFKSNNRNNGYAIPVDCGPTPKEKQPLQNNERRWLSPYSFKSSASSPSKPSLKQRVSRRPGCMSMRPSKSASSTCARNRPPKRRERSRRGNKPLPPPRIP